MVDISIVGRFYFKKKKNLLMGGLPVANDNSTPVVNGSISFIIVLNIKQISQYFLPVLFLETLEQYGYRISNICYVMV